MRPAKGPSLGDPLVQVTGSVQADLGPFLQGDEFITLTDDLLTVRVHKDGRYEMLMDSRNLAPRYMKRDGRLTELVREHWRDYHLRSKPKHEPNTFGYLEQWIKAHPYRSFGKEPVYPEGRKGWEMGEHGSGNSFDFTEECWLGDVFMFAHFYTEKSEGAVILWHKGGDIRGNYMDPEVWVGDFSGFINEQHWCDWYESDGFRMWNDNLGGSMMWALDKMGAFEPGNDLSKVIYQAIVDEPEIAIKPVDIGVLRNERAFPPEVVRAVRDHAEKRA